MMFLNRVRLVLGMALVFLFVACGGNSSGYEQSITEQISSRKNIVILYNFPEDECYRYKTEKGLYKDPIVSVESNDVTCETYGKSSEEIGCVEEDREYYVNTSCVIGYDKIQLPY